MAPSGLIFLYGEAVPFCTHTIDKHYVGYCTLQYMSAGIVDLRIGERRHRLEGRWFWSAYPGPRIAFHAADGCPAWNHHYLAFQGSLLKRWERHGLFPVPPMRSPADADFSVRLDALLRQSLATDRRGVLTAIHMLEGILLELTHAPVQVRPQPPWLQKAIERIGACARGGEVDYDALAEDLGTSPATLRRRFREVIGMSPHEYLLHCRAAEARRLLGESNLPIKQIATLLGYRDVYFFSRQFRQLTGVPPATYRRSRQG